MPPRIATGNVPGGGAAAPATPAADGALTVTPENLMKEENSAYQMRWVTILMGQPDTKQ